MANNNSGGTLVLLAILVLGGVGMYSLSPYAPWNASPRPQNSPPNLPHRPNPLPVLPALPNAGFGRYEGIELPDGSILLTDTVTGDLYKAGAGEARAYTERPNPAGK